jgi:hypothetical protein
MIELNGKYVTVEKNKEKKIQWKESTLSSAWCKSTLSGDEILSCDFILELNLIHPIFFITNNYNN